MRVTTTRTLEVDSEDGYIPVGDLREFLDGLSDRAVVDFSEYRRITALSIKEYRND